MNRWGTVYLTGKFAPGDTDWDQGYLRNHTAAGIWVCQTDWSDNGCRFYPAHAIERIEYR